MKLSKNTLAWLEIGWEIIFAIYVASHIITDLFALGLYITFRLWPMERSKNNALRTAGSSVFWIKLFH